MNLTLKRPLVMVLVVMLVMAGILTLVGVGIRYSSSAQGSSFQEKAKERNEYVALREALRRGGLREAAKLKGHYSGEFEAHLDHALLDSEMLTKNSQLVVVGRVSKRGKARLVAEDQLIVTDYEVVAQEVIKGGINGRTFRVGLIGGHIDFGDGTSAELKTPTFEHVKEGNLYLFFLGGDESDPGAFSLVGGPQGVLEMGTGDNALKSHGRPSDPIAEETRSENKDSFLRKVREQAKKWPAPGKCCS